MTKNYDEEVELTPEELEKVSGGLRSLKRFGAKDKGLLVKKGKKFKVVENGRELEIEVTAAYNGSVIGGF